MPLALNICVSAPPACAHTEDYFAFARQRDHVPLYVASACYGLYTFLKLDLGHYVRTARAATFFISYALFWLALVAVETARALLRRRMTQPGEVLVALPLVALASLAVALVSDALVNSQARLSPHAPAFVWIVQLAKALVVGVAPSVAGIAWGYAAGAAALAGALLVVVALTWMFESLDGYDALVHGAILAVLWGASFEFYASAYLVVANALLAAAFVAVVVGRTEWAFRERCVDKCSVSTLCR